MWAEFIGRLRPKLAEEFVQVVCTTCRNRFFEILIFTVFSPTLDFEKVASIYKCICTYMLVLNFV